MTVLTALLGTVGMQSLLRNHAVGTILLTVLHDDKAAVLNVLAIGTTLEYVSLDIAYGCRGRLGE